MKPLSPATRQSVRRYVADLIVAIGLVCLSMLGAIALSHLIAGCRPPTGPDGGGFTDELRPFTEAELSEVIADIDETADLELLAAEEDATLSVRPAPTQPPPTGGLPASPSVSDRYRSGGRRVVSSGRLTATGGRSPMMPDMIDTTFYYGRTVTWAGYNGGAPVGQIVTERFTRPRGIPTWSRNVRFGLADGSVYSRTSRFGTWQRFIAEETVERPRFALSSTLIVTSAGPGITDQDATIEVERTTQLGRIRSRIARPVETLSTDERDPSRFIRRVRQGVAGEIRTRYYRANGSIEHDVYTSGRADGGLVTRSDYPGGNGSRGAFVRESIHIGRPYGTIETSYWTTE